MIRLIGSQASSVDLEQMTTQCRRELVKLNCFVQATRDSGYKSAAYALAELIDNALEAKAEHVDIELIASSEKANVIVAVVVTDDGTGMSPDTLALALQFGGSTRFDSRKGSGRFGMGLPNSSLSQARRVDVTTWQTRGAIWTTHLDADQILAGVSDRIPRPRQSSYAPKSRSGTVVRLSKCDRFQFRSIAEAETGLKRDLGRLFRDAIFDGSLMKINGRTIEPFDPLFLRGRDRSARATSFGPPLVYPIRLPKANAISHVAVRFAQLPLEAWSGLSNQQKNRLGIAKGAGVSVLRAGREIDHGWYFMGSKRKENYDDWWRCEVRFGPELDELFGVTHTKQGVRPTDELQALLAPDLERIARELNSSVRKQYVAIKGNARKSTPLRQADKRDYLLEPPSMLLGHQTRQRAQKPVGIKTSLGGLRYIVETERLATKEFYDIAISGVQVTIVLNELHPFYERLYRRIHSIKPSTRETPVIENLKALLAAAARAELALDLPAHREIIHRFRLSWSNALMAFLS